MLRPNPAIRADATSLLVAREASLIRMIRAARQRMLNRFFDHTPSDGACLLRFPQGRDCGPQICGVLRLLAIDTVSTTPFHCEVSHSVPKRPHCGPLVQPNSRARLAVICWFACVSLLLATAPVLWKGLLDEPSVRVGCSSDETSAERTVGYD